jgi:hypothetical protein
LNGLLAAAIDDGAMLPLTQQNGKKKVSYEPQDPEKRRANPPVAIQMRSHPEQQTFAVSYG